MITTGKRQPASRAQFEWRDWVYSHFPALAALVAIIALVAAIWIGRNHFGAGLTILLATLAAIVIGSLVIRSRNKKKPVLAEVSNQFSPSKAAQERGEASVRRNDRAPTWRPSTKDRIPTREILGGDRWTARGVTPKA